MIAQHLSGLWFLKVGLIERNWYRGCAGAINDTGWSTGDDIQHVVQGVQRPPNTLLQVRVIKERIPHAQDSCPLEIHAMMLQFQFPVRSNEPCIHSRSSKDKIQRDYIVTGKLTFQ
ncbi:hypothetical protein TMatcc_006279 [Talaromyces marneffei ATCC 18224]